MAIDRLDPYGALTRESGEPTTNAAPSRSMRGALAESGLIGALNRMIERGARAEGIAQALGRADLALRPAEWLAIRVGVVALFVGVSLLIGVIRLPTFAHPLTLIGAGLVGYLLPRMWLARRTNKRLNAFNASLADTITLIANALRSGSSFLQALELVVRETHPPISTEFNRVIREVSLGRPLEQALGHLVRRVRSDDLELMATAITIQYQVGGNLAEILDTISATIRERVRIRGEIRTLTAQQRLSGYIIAALPLAIATILSLISPRFLEPMFQAPPAVLGVPLGIVLLMIGGINMLIGFLIIRRIIAIKV
ncbi:MAG: type II secretion system F family protein [Chloroflexota bacterium]|nr:type II secretion system F family protein [Chloroflexota bacterium]